MRPARTSAPPPSVSTLDFHTPGRRSPVPSHSSVGLSSANGSFNVGPSLSVMSATGSTMAKGEDPSESVLGQQLSRISLGSSILQQDSPGKTIATTQAKLPPEVTSRWLSEASGISFAAPFTGCSADAAAGGASIVNMSGTKGDTMMTGDTAAAGAANLSDVPDVLRQHLDRRKAQLQSMQQRLAKLSSECDSLQGLMTSAEG